MTILSICSTNLSQQLSYTARHSTKYKTKFKNQLILTTTFKEILMSSQKRKREFILFWLVTRSIMKPWEKDTKAQWVRSLSRLRLQTIISWTIKLFRCRLIKTNRSWNSSSKCPSMRKARTRDVRLAFTGRMKRAKVNCWIHRYWEVIRSWRSSKRIRFWASRWQLWRHKWRMIHLLLSIRSLMKSIRTNPRWNCIQGPRLYIGKLFSIIRISPRKLFSKRTSCGNRTTQTYHRS